MSKFAKRDILLHFDEEKEEIVFYTVDSEILTEIRNQEFDGARSDIKWFQEQSADEAEKALGSMAFSLMDSFSKKKLGIRDYEALSKKAHREYVAEIEEQAKTKDPEALYHLFVERHSRALQEKSIECLEEAEALLKESASLGFKEAQNRLKNDWQLMHGAALRSIQRAKNT